MLHKCPDGYKHACICIYFHAFWISLACSWRKLIQVCVRKFGIDKRAFSPYRYKVYLLPVSANTYMSYDVLSCTLSLFLPYFFNLNANQVSEISCQECFKYYGRIVSLWNISGWQVPEVPWTTISLTECMPLDPIFLMRCLGYSH